MRKRRWIGAPREGSRRNYLEKLGHGPSLLLGDCGVFLLDHAEAGNGELELDFDFGLLRMSVVVLQVLRDSEEVGTTTEDEGAILEELLVYKVVGERRCQIGCKFVVCAQESSYACGGSWPAAPPVRKA